MTGPGGAGRGRGVAIHGYVFSGGFSLGGCS